MVQRMHSCNSLGNGISINSRHVVLCDREGGTRSDRLRREDTKLRCNRRCGVKLRLQMQRNDVMM